MRASDLDVLRQHGLDDVALHDAVQVIAYFNYINRIADATHVDLEPEMRPYA
jgi:alkylhydroperoxidase family enzyme